MENKSHALAAGAFVLALLALLVGLAVWLTRDTRELRLYELSSAEAVTGLQAQASVRFKGVNVGKVTTIGFDPVLPGQVLIQIAVDAQTPITSATFAALGFQGVTGLAFIQLDDAGPAGARLPLNSAQPSRIPMRSGLLAKLSSQGESILLQLEQTSRRLNQLLAPENQQHLMAAIDDMGQAAASLKQLSSHTNQVLPALLDNTNTTLQTLKATSLRVGDSADEARKSARAFRTVSERMNEKGGTLDQLAQGVQTLASTGQTLNTMTLPRLHRAVDDAARMTRQIDRTASTVNDNLQTLIFGNAPVPPGPGEADFVSPAIRP